MITIRKCTIAELKEQSTFSVLFAEYAFECAIDGLPAPDEKMRAYDLIEKSGIFQAYGAFYGESLCGFMAVLTPVIPHYGVGVAVTESLFVGTRYRATGAGLALLRAAEQHAKDAGSPALMVSAPADSTLEALLNARRGYQLTNVVFLKVLS